ncbi:hypothetical protein N9500_04505 [Candidatus Pelagibacter sp.]|nr:hypothetical protein [Candidatus Pelagibacter sp.]
MNLFLYLSFYIFILFSIIGYGNIFHKIFFKKDIINLGYLGFFGIFSLLIITYTLNFFIPLSAYVNLSILFLGLLSFYNLLNKNFFEIKKNFYLIGIIFLILTIFILSAKNHDDFPYYHFAYIQLITKFSNSLGIGLFNHGFRTPSSIFYLSSLFYLPKTGYNLIHLAPVFFLGFANYIFINKIYVNLKNKENFYIIFLSLLSFALANIFFYRMAEHGTDRSAQIIILIIFIELLQLVNLRKFDVNLFNKILILITITISLKAFYVIYIIFLLPIVYYQKNRITFLINFFKNKIVYLCAFLFFLVILMNFFNTGCLIYPLSMTCNEKLIWSISLEQVHAMNNWYQLWSKGGATPNSIVQDKDTYIEGFNWVNNWFNVYFFNKISDYLLSISFLILVFFITFYNKASSKFVLKERKYLIPYIIIFILFCEWFNNHPALRYGGYHLIALLIFLPTSLLIEKKIIFNKNLITKVNIMLLIIILVFVSRNILRINKEIGVYNFDFYNNASYNKIFQNHKHYNNILRIKNCHLTKKCSKEHILILRKFNKDIFYTKK